MLAMVKRSRKSSSNATPRSADNARSAMSGSGTPPSQPAGPPAWSAALVLAIAVGAVYGRSLNAPFIFDDHAAIIDNPSIKQLWPLVGTPEQPGPLHRGAPGNPTAGRPLANFSLAMNYRFGGLNPFGYHLFSLVLHYGCAVLLWAITRRTLLLPYFGHRFASSAGWLALVVAAIWALHPLQTEAVIYASQRTEVMMAFFYLATIYCSLRYWRALGYRRTIWLTLAFIACLCGMASKEVMVSAPLMILLYERTFLAGSLTAALRRSWPLHAALFSTLTLAIALNLSAPRGDSAGFQYVALMPVWWMTQCQMFWMYLKLVAWPHPLLIHYELPYLGSLAEAWAYVVPLALAAVGTMVLLWRNRPSGLLLAWAFAILSPTFVVPVLTEMAAERRMYLALAALLPLIVVGGYLLMGRAIDARESRASNAAVARGRGLAILAAGLLMTVVFGWLSADRLSAYQHEQGLWQEVLEWQPDNPIAHANLGYQLEQHGDTTAAIEEYREAIRLRPDGVVNRQNLGTLLLRADQPREASAEFKAALEYRPDDITLQNNLAVSLFMSGQNLESLQACRRALEIDANNWSAHSNLGMVQQKIHQYPEAIRSFEKALQLNPKALDIYSDLANTYALQNDRAKALATLEHGLQLAEAAGDTVNAQLFRRRLETNQQ